MNRLFRPTLFGWLLVGSAVAQPVLHLKTRPITVDPVANVLRIDTPVPFSRGHLILQLREPPSASTIEALRVAGVTVLEGIPENGLLVAVNGPVRVDGLGVRYAAPLDPADKISPLLSALNPVRDRTGWLGYYLVEFHQDVDLGYARSLVLGLGLELREHPDLGASQLMIHVSDREQLARDLKVLAAQDETAYIFPASADLAAGIPVRAYARALTTLGAVSQAIPTYGDGWDGPGLNPASISYVFSKVTAQLPLASAESEIVRAMAEWAKVAEIAWQPASDPNGARTVNILFASYAHGDGYPFDGPGGALAHTFYPAPPNPEPIAGDMHFDDSETWRVGANTDLFSVALHELGHALGLGHSDNPNDVMYPYYKIVTTLSPGDIAAVLTLYAAQNSTPPSPPPAPAPPPIPIPAPGPKDTTAPSLSIISPGGSTISTSSPNLTFSGTASDNVGVMMVTWSTNTGSSGTATGTTSWSATVPLLVGSNQVTVRASDAAGNVGWRSVVVSRH